MINKDHIPTDILVELETYGSHKPGSTLPLIAAGDLIDFKGTRTLKTNKTF
jgi:hypothetical protein